MTTGYKWHALKIQELNDDDEFDRRRRADACQIMSERIINNQHLRSIICFADECSFYAKGLLIVIIVAIELTKAHVSERARKIEKN